MRKVELMNEVAETRVVVFGPNGSGKSTLTRHLNENTFRRTLDRKSLRFIFVEGDPNKRDIFPEFDFAIFTISLGDGPAVETTWNEIKDLTLQIYSNHLDRICVVGTKCDLVTHDFGEEDIAIRRLSTSVPFSGSMKYVATSVSTGTGMEELLLYIANQIYPPPPKQNHLQVLFRNATEFLLDTIASIFALDPPENINDETPDTYDLPDDETVNSLCCSSIAKDYDAYHAQFNPWGGPWGGCPAKKITPRLIAKTAQLTERPNTTFARARFKGIPIPQPRYPHLKQWFVTEFVEGRMLLDCWNSLSMFKKFRVACTLRIYISQVHRLTRSTPGSIVEGRPIYGNVYDCAQRMLYRPLESSKKFHEWVHDIMTEGWLLHCRRHADRMREKGAFNPASLPPKPPSPGDSDSPLVFIHGDLSPSNIILSDNGALWLIDWADAGFYPAWMEAVAAWQYGGHSRSWRHLLWFVVGPRPAIQDGWQYVPDHILRHAFGYASDY